MRRIKRTVFAGLLLLAGCSVRSLPPVPEHPGQAAPVCQAAPNGGPLQADRGIGGTGAPAVGAPAVRQADRGIGGTGIIGVITGFASICIGGQEVGYDAAVPVSIDDRPADLPRLRVGQVAAIVASGPAAGLLARQVAIRHEVVGPVESAEATGGLRVAGQAVMVTRATLGETAVRPGDWVAVSGLRDAQGVVQATRIDLVVQGAVRLRGRVRREGGTVRMGLLEVRFGPAVLGVPDGPVLLDGRLADGFFYAERVAPDDWSADALDRPSVFGPEIAFVFTEAFAGYAEGRLVLERNRRARDGTGLQRSLMELERQPNGSLRPARGSVPLSGGVSANGNPSRSPLLGGGPVTQASERRLEAAPMPERGGLGDRGGSGLAPMGQPFGGRVGFPGRGR